MKTGKLLNIKSARSGEKIWAAFAGEYIDDKGKIQGLTNPEADTLRTLKKLTNPEEQFEFYCFAYIRSLWDIWMRQHSYNKIQEEFLEMKDRFDMPWHTQAIHILPLNESYKADAISKSGIDRDLLRKYFKEYYKYEFIIY
jgi:hypothetical protein